MLMHNLCVPTRQLFISQQLYIVYAYPMCTHYYYTDCALSMVYAPGFTPAVPSVPLNVTLHGSTPTSLQVSWSTPSFSNGANLTYHVEYTGVATLNAVNDSFSTPNFLESSTTSVTISGLVPFSTYTIGVSASTSAGAGPAASIKATTAESGEWHWASHMPT